MSHSTKMIKAPAPNLTPELSFRWIYLCFQRTLSPLRCTRRVVDRRRAWLTQLTVLKGVLQHLSMEGGRSFTLAMATSTHRKLLRDDACSGMCSAKGGIGHHAMVRFNGKARNGVSLRRAYTVHFEMPHPNPAGTWVLQTRTHAGVLAVSTPPSRVIRLLLPYQKALFRL